MTDIRQGITITICSTITAIALIMAIAISTTTKYEMQTITKEHETALALVKHCGEREWVAWWEYHPMRGRRIKCLEKRIPAKLYTKKKSKKKLKKKPIKIDKG